MKKRKKVKYIHEGRYVAKVEVEPLEDETGWSPYFITDAYTYYLMASIPISMIYI